MPLTKRERELAERRADVEAGGVGSRATGVWRKGTTPADYAMRKRERKLQAAATGQLGSKKQRLAQQHIAERKEDPSSPFYDPAPIVPLPGYPSNAKAKGGLIKSSRKKSKSKIDGIARKGKTRAKHR